MGLITIKSLRTVDSIMGVFTKTINELNDHEEYMANQAMKYEDEIVKAVEAKTIALGEVEKAKQRGGERK